MDNRINQDDSSRIFNPSNHDIVVDNDGSYYIDYGGRKLDSYNESIKVNEKMEKLGIIEKNVKIENIAGSCVYSR